MKATRPFVLLGTIMLIIATSKARDENDIIRFNSMNADILGLNSEREYDDNGEYLYARLWPAKEDAPVLQDIFFDSFPRAALINIQPGKLIEDPLGFKMGSLNWPSLKDGSKGPYAPLLVFLKNREIMKENSEVFSKEISFKFPEPYSSSEKSEGDSVVMFVPYVDEVPSSDFSLESAYLYDVEKGPKTNGFADVNGVILFFSKEVDVASDDLAKHFKFVNNVGDEADVVWAYGQDRKLLLGRSAESLQGLTLSISQNAKSIDDESLLISSKIEELVVEVN